VRRKLARRQRVSVELFKSGHQDAGRSAERPGGDESGRAKSEFARPRRWRDGDRKYRRFYSREFEICELRFQSAGGQFACRLSRAQTSDFNVEHERVERKC